MNRIIQSLMLLAVSALTLSARTEAEDAGKAVTSGTQRIGVYDSRAVAVAYAGSVAFEKKLAPLFAEQKQAKTEGDQQRLAKLDAQGRELQKQLHMQGFSTAPVDDILETIKDELPAIMRRADVAALVSKWDKAALKKYPGARQVDVTMALVDAFHPNERQRQSAVEIQKRKPISLKKAARIDD